MKSVDAIEHVAVLHLDVGERARCGVVGRARIPPHGRVLVRRGAVAEESKVLDREVGACARRVDPYVCPVRITCRNRRRARPLDGRTVSTQRDPYSVVDREIAAKVYSGWEKDGSLHGNGRIDRSLNS